MNTEIIDVKCECLNTTVENLFGRVIYDSENEELDRRYEKLNQDFYNTLDDVPEDTFEEPKKKGSLIGKFVKFVFISVIGLILWNILRIVWIAIKVTLLPGIVK